MPIFWTILYVIVALVVIWWVLGQAKKLDQEHGGDEHGQNQHHE